MIVLSLGLSRGEMGGGRVVFEERGSRLYDLKISRSFGIFFKSGKIQGTLVKVIVHSVHYKLFTSYSYTIYLAGDRVNYVY